jgi:Zn-dependent M28 family amino/carboxypeptidase
VKPIHRCLLAVLLLSGPPALAAEELAALRAHLAFLADDRLEGRDTGSRGHELAALYAETRLAEYGLRPGNGDSWEQRIPFVSARIASSTITRVDSGGAQRLEWKTDFLASGTPAHANVELTAAVVFAGYGIEAPELGRDDYASIDARGKLVLMLSGAPESFPIDQRAHYSASRTKLENAARHGAVGVLTLGSRADERRVPWQRRMLYAGRPSFHWRHPDGAVQDAFPELEYLASLSPAGAQKLLAGSGLEFEALLDGAERGEVTPRALALRLTVAAQSEIAEVTSPNVLALLPGSDQKLRDEVVVLTAHLDHIGVGPAVDGDTICNGYYDNAMGSAIVLELARRLAALPVAPRRPVLVALVTGEEKGLLGADYLAHHPPAPLATPVADVNIDMPLFLAPLGSLIAYGAEHSSLGPLASRAAAAHGFRLSSDPYPAEVIFVRSDQYAFVRRGVPALFLDAGYETSGGGDAQRLAAEEFLRLHYHRPSDDAKLPTDWDSVARFTATAFDLLRAVADGDRPRWNPGDFFGDRFGGAAARVP